MWFLIALPHRLALSPACDGLQQRAAKVEIDNFDDFDNALPKTSRRSGGKSKKGILIAVLAFVLVAATGIVWATGFGGIGGGDGGLRGTWELNTRQSRFSGGNPTFDFTRFSLEPIPTTIEFRGFNLCQVFSESYFV